jgi:hypothetical protein
MADDAGLNQPGIVGQLYFRISFPQFSDVVEFIH